MTTWFSCMVEHQEGPSGPVALAPSAGRLTAHVVLSHPDAPAEKFSVQDVSRDEIEVGILRTLYDYAQRHGVSYKDVASTVTWPS